MKAEPASEWADFKTNPPRSRKTFRVELVLVTHDALLDSKAVEDYLIKKVGNEGKILVADAEVEKVPSQN